MSVAAPTAEDASPARPTPGRVRRLIQRALQPKTIILGTAVIVVAYLAIVPIIYLVLGTFVGPEGLTLDSFRRAYSTADFTELAFNSATFAIGATTVSLTIGSLLAFLTERTDVRWKRVIFASALVPLVIPGLLYTISWIFLLSPRIGIYNKVLEPIFGPGALDVFTIGGLIFVEGLAEAPVAFLLMVAAFRSMDPSLEESAMMSGVPVRTLFRKITLPLVRPALFGAFLLTFVKNLQTFEGPALLGVPGNVWVFTSEIWRSLNFLPPDYGAAGALSLTLVAVTTVGMWIYYRSTRGAKRYQTISGKGFRPRTIPLGRMRGPVSNAVIVYFFLTIVVPVMMLVYMSTQKFYSIPTLDKLGRASLDSYREVLARPETLDAFVHSFVLSIATGLIVLGLAALVSWFTVRSRVRGRWLLDNLMLLPLSLPGLVIGVSLLFVYLRFPLPIYGTLWILLIAYVTGKLPHGMRYASASMYQIGSDLDESAQVSGASWLEVFRRIYLPLLFPGLFAGFLFIVLTTMRELGSSLLLYSPGNEVISTMIWEMYANGQFTQLAALGVILIGISLCIVTAAHYVARRYGFQAR